MFEFLKLNQKAFGLEITDTAVRLEQLAKRQNRIVQRRTFSASLDKGIVSGGEIKNESELAKIIKRGIKEKKINAKLAAVSLPEEKTFLKIIKMPAMPLENLSQVIVYEAENYIPLSLENVYLDFEIIDGKLSSNNKNNKNNTKNVSDNFEVLLTAVPRTVVDSYVSALITAGLTPFILEPEAQAIARSIAAKKTLNNSVLIIHIGDSKTTLIFYSANTIRFTYTIPISNIYFNEVIAKNAGVPPERAEYFKNAYGISINSVKSTNANSEQESILRQKIFESLIPGLIDFIQQVAKCVSYYKTHYDVSAKQPQKIILCGAGSRLNGLGDFISLKLDLPVFENPDQSLINAVGGDFTVAHGLALRALSESRAIQ